MKLDGKVALVTGGGRGIGRAIARRFGREGAQVAVAARTRGELEGVRDEIAAAGGDALAVVCDVAVEDDVARMAEEVAGRFGRIDILVNSAGIRGSVRPLVDTEMEEWRRVLDTDLTGTFLCMRAVMKEMAAWGKGTVINISSMAGKNGYSNMAAYCAAKFGIMGLSAAARREWAPLGIRVCVICPAGVDTGLRHAAHPDGESWELIAPEEVADAALWLAALEGNAAVHEVIMESGGKRHAHLFI